jgi:selenophosphate synthetase-related protein
MNIQDCPSPPVSSLISLDPWFLCNTAMMVDGFVKIVQCGGAPKPVVLPQSGVVTRP